VSGTTQQANAERGDLSLQQPQFLNYG
jgi:hypothetical protein